MAPRARPLLAGLALAAGLALVCLLALAVAPALRRAGAFVGGGPPRRGPDPRRSAHLVVDALNLVHWLLRDPAARPSPEAVAAAIDATAPALTARHPDRVIYVVKDRESALNTPAAHAVYRLAAERNGVYIAVAERYADPPRGVPVSAEHSARGRDDFLLAVLAHRYRCAALTEDRFRDFARFRATLQPFHFYEFAFWRHLPHRDFIRPEAAAFARLRPPPAVRYAAYFPELRGTLEAPAAPAPAPEPDRPPW